MAATETTKSQDLHRSVGLFQGIAINMTQMCGIGPFITIPLMIAALGGPQAIFGWLVGALLAIFDGLVWAELGAAMPGAGGTYVYLREAFQYRLGRLMPFLFAWTAVLFIPLIMSTGAIGMADYLGYYFPNGLSSTAKHWIAIGAVVVVVIALYRRIESISRLTTVLWVIMLIAVGGTILAAFSDFDGGQAFDFTPGAFGVHGAFWAGLGSGLIIAVYDYLGYNTVAYLGAELKDPGRVMPRAIIYSILGIMGLYLLLNIGVLGAVPWQEAQTSTSVASLVFERNWGKVAAQIFTALIVVTAAASVFAGLLGGSRVPYNAAKDRLFLPWFGKLHPRGDFPHVAVLAMGAITMVGTLFTLTDIINMLFAVAFLVQSVGQIVALVELRRRQPTLRRPYRMWLYPVPGVLALAGWIYVYKSTGTTPILLSLVWIAAGVVAFLVWARIERTWPFGPKEIREEFLAQTT